MRKQTIGLALGSGGAKGFAHIGVFKALEEHQVKIDVVAGSSMGSMVGAFYAMGMRPTMMEGLATSLKWRHWVDLTVPKMGMVVGDKVRDMVALLTRNADIQETNVPLAIVATDLKSQRSVCFRSGRIADAVRASISIPGIFIPYVWQEGMYVDGGVLDPIPVRAAYALGANVVIAVDVSSNAPVSPPESMADVIWQSLDVMQAFAFSTRNSEADFTVTPDLREVGTSSFHKARQAIAAGYQATIAVMPQILELCATDTKYNSGS
jgi:NTE family protein